MDVEYWRYAHLVTWRNAVVAFCVGVVSATLLAYLAPWWWGFDLLANMRAHLLVAAGFLVAVAIGFGLRAFAAVVAVAFVLNATFIVPWYLDRPQPPATGARFSIGHLNAQTRNQDPGPLMEAAEADALGVDVYVILEPGKGWRNRFTKPLGPYAVIHPEGKPDAIVLSKLPVSDAREPNDRDLPDAAVELTVQTATGPVRVLGVDTASPGTPVQGYARDVSFDAMARWRQAQTGTVVMLGDWNATFWSSGYRELVERSDLEPVQQGYGVLQSWTTLLGPLGLPIDHQLYSRDLVPAGVELGPSFGSWHHSLLVHYVESDSPNGARASGTAAGSTPAG